MYKSTVRGGTVHGSSTPGAAAVQHKLPAIFAFTEPYTSVSIPWEEGLFRCSFKTSDRKDFPLPALNEQRGYFTVFPGHLTYGPTHWMDESPRRWFS